MSHQIFDNKTVLIIGSNGLLGHEMVRQAKLVKNWHIITSDKSDPWGIDITKENSINKFFKKYRPDVAINCAAYTDVEGAEELKGFEIAKAVNGYGPGKLAKYCKEYNVDFVHYSTDYVFGDNKEDGYSEDYDRFKPLNKYGETKLLGEQEVTKIMRINSNSKFPSKANHSMDVIAHSQKFYIIRTSWLFGTGSKNFISKILELAKNREYLEVVTDEVSSPTYVKDLAKKTINIVKERPESGIYHVTGRGHCSRFEFAKAILTWAKINIEVRPTTLKRFNRKAKIPHYSFLVNTKLPKMRTWQEMVKDYVISTKNQL